MCSYIWGAIADSKGRKPVLIISSILLGLTSAGFGFSVTFTMAVLLRFFVGLFNGIPGSIKAVLSESSDDKNQVKVLFHSLSLSLSLCLSICASGGWVCWWVCQSVCQWVCAAPYSPTFHSLCSSASPSPHFPSPSMQALSIAVFSTGWGMGMVMGPAVGGTYIHATQPIPQSPASHHD